MSRPPEFDRHAGYIKQYIETLGLFGVTQEIRFVLNEYTEPECQEALDALEEFQKSLIDIQTRKVDNFLAKGIGNGQGIGVK